MTLYKPIPPSRHLPISSCFPLHPAAVLKQIQDLFTMPQLLCLHFSLTGGQHAAETGATRESQRHRAAWMSEKSKFQFCFSTSEAAEHQASPSASPGLTPLTVRERPGPNSWHCPHGCVRVCTAPSKNPVTK